VIQDICHGLFWHAGVVTNWCSREIALHANPTWVEIFSEISLSAPLYPLYIYPEAAVARLSNPISCQVIDLDYSQGSVQIKIDISDKTIGFNSLKMILKTYTEKLDEIQEVLSSASLEMKTFRVPKLSGEQLILPGYLSDETTNTFLQINDFLHVLDQLRDQCSEIGLTRIRMFEINFLGIQRLCRQTIIEICQSALAEQVLNSSKL
jgi:hypothetical protein